MKFLKFILAPRPYTRAEPAANATAKLKSRSTVNMDAVNT